MHINPIHEQINANTCISTAYLRTKFLTGKSTNAPKSSGKSPNLKHKNPSPPPKNFHLSLLIECWSFHPRLHLSRLAHLSCASSLGVRKTHRWRQISGAFASFSRAEIGDPWPCFWPWNQVNHWMKSLSDIRFTKILFSCFQAEKLGEFNKPHVTSKNCCAFLQQSHHSDPGH